MDKVWQMMQSNDTKTMNLDKDIEELTSKAQQTERNGSTKAKDLGRRRIRPVIKVLCAQNTQMESIMNFVAERFSLEEMKVLQGVSVVTSVWARECQYKDILYRQHPHRTHTRTFSLRTLSHAGCDQTFGSRA